MNIFIQENAFENVGCRMSAILCRLQYVQSKFTLLCKSTVLLNYIYIYIHMNYVWCYSLCHSRKRAMIICSCRCVFSGIPCEWLPDIIVEAVREESQRMMDICRNQTQPTNPSLMQMNLKYTNCFVPNLQQRVLSLFLVSCGKIFSFIVQNLFQFPVPLYNISMG